MSGQLDLFGTSAEERSGADSAGGGDGRGVEPAEVPDAVLRLAEALPTSVSFGTSSWSFPGWAGLVYRSEHRSPELARRGLAAYAAHPLLGAVGLDRTYYEPLPADTLAELAAQTPPGFRFLVKAHEDCTIARFPDHPRYGVRRGEPNPRFLDPAYALDAVVGPTTEGLGDRLGVLLFQLPPTPAEQVGGGRAFAERLWRFLDRLPSGLPVAVELRTRSLFTADYQAALRAGSAAHCFNVHPSMPPIAAQWARMGGADEDGPLVVRWMLRAGDRYGSAKSRFAPFDRIVEEDVPSRRGIAEMVATAAASGRPVMVIANNKAEGCSPRSLEHLAEEVVGRLTGEAWRG